MVNRVAIMTWYCFNNYGTVLQVYSLRKMIQSLGVDTVDVIQYIPKHKRKSILKRFTYDNLKTKITVANDIRIQNLIKEKDNKFDVFREKYLTLSPKAYSPTDLFMLNDIYDKFVCGSDQIWSPLVFDENYFLTFVKNDSKKIAYAPSMGLSSIDSFDVKDQIKQYVAKIPYLSVRETYGQDIIKKYTGLNAKVVLDPTLLYTKEEWNRKFSLENNDLGDYVLFYELGNNPKHYNLAKMYAKNTNCKLIVVPGTFLDYTKKDCEIYNASPVEFMELIYNAKMVITDSFHSTIFAINFNKPFITLKRFKDTKKSQNSRIYSILQMLNLTNRLYADNLNYFLENSDIDYTEVNEILKKRRKESLEYLKSALNSEIEKENKQIITNRCTGCGVCKLVCPKNCISIKLNNQGFYEYEIDQDKCINCGMCKKVCGQLNKEKTYIKDQNLYSAFSNDSDVLNSSSTGGLAYELSKLAIQKGIPVIGCTYDYKENIAKHIQINNIQDISKITGSKYIQSYTLPAFETISKLEKALVIGMPCQIASLDRYLSLKGKRDNFILIDLICLGVPTYFLWKKYITDKPQIHNVKFRDKKYTWRKRHITIKGKDMGNETKNHFYYFFKDVRVNNKACYDCIYRDAMASDIRLGDYWGKKFKDNTTGVNMVITNGDVGDTFLKELHDMERITMQRQPLEDYFNNQQIRYIPIPDDREKLISELKDENISFNTFVKKYYLKGQTEIKLKKVLGPIYKK